MKVDLDLQNNANKTKKRKREETAPKKRRLLKKNKKTYDNVDDANMDNAHIEVDLQTNGEMLIVSSREIIEQVRIDKKWCNGNRKYVLSSIF